MVGAGMRHGCLVSVSSCFLTFLSLSPCSFDLGLFVSANCLCEPAWQIRYIQNQFKEVQFVAQIYVCVVTGRLDLSQGHWRPFQSYELQFDRHLAICSNSGRHESTHPRVCF